MCDVYLTAGLEVLALGVDALVVVDVVLPAVLGLVLVGEACVEACACLLLVSCILCSSSAHAAGYGAGIRAFEVGYAYRLYSVSIASSK